MGTEFSIPTTGAHADFIAELLNPLGLASLGEDYNTFCQPMDREIETIRPGTPTTELVNAKQETNETHLRRGKSTQLVSTSLEIAGLATAVTPLVHDTTMERNGTTGKMETASKRERANLGVVSARIQDTSRTTV